MAVLTPKDTVSNPFPSGLNLPTGSTLGIATGLGGDLQTQLRDPKTRLHATVELYSPI